MIEALIILAAGGFLGAVGIRLFDFAREVLKLRSARLDAIEAEFKKLREDHEALGRASNSTVLGLQQHDRELTRIAFKLNIRRDDSPMDGPNTVQ